MQATLFPFAFALLWASSYSGGKIGLLYITPFLFIGIRLGIAAVAAFGIARLRGLSFAPLKRSWPHLLVVGALAHGLALSTAHVALVTMDATPLGLVHAFHPVLTASIAALLLAEPFRWWQWLGAALGFAGVLLGVPWHSPGGILVMLLLSLFGLSGGTLYMRRFCPDAPPFQATVIQLAGGSAFALAAMPFFEAPHAEWTGPLAGAMAWNIIGTSIIGTTIYNHMLERYGAGRAASAFFVVPGASALVAALTVGERLSVIGFFGLIAATVGVMLVWWRPAARRA